MTIPDTDLAAQTETDHLTIMTCVDDHYATKVITATEAGPQISPYDNATYFSVRRVRVCGMDDLAGKLTRLSGCPRSFVIRGEPIEGVDLSSTRRLLHRSEDGAEPTMKPWARRWLLIDFDSVQPPMHFDPTDGEFAAHWLRELLPPQFDQASFWWSFTSGATLKPGLRMRLAFWLSQPLWQAELERWLADVPCDKALFRPVQPNYVASPIFRGMADPVQRRCGYVQDVYDTVDASDIPPPPPPPQTALPAPYPLARSTEQGVGPLGVLEDVCAKIMTTQEGTMNSWGHPGRHSAIFCAALRMAWFILKGKIDRTLVFQALIAAARNAGITDAREVERTIKNGLREGGA